MKNSPITPASLTRADTRHAATSRFGSRAEQQADYRAAKKQFRIEDQDATEFLND